MKKCLTLCYDIIYIIFLFYITKKLSFKQGSVDFLYSLYIFNTLRCILPATSMYSQYYRNKKCSLIFQKNHGDGKADHGILTLARK